MAAAKDSASASAIGSSCPRHRDVAFKNSRKMGWQRTETLSRRHRWPLWVAKSPRRYTALFCNTATPSTLWMFAAHAPIASWHSSMLLSASTGHARHAQPPSHHGTSSPEQNDEHEGSDSLSCKPPNESEVTAWSAIRNQVNIDKRYRI